MHIIKLLLMTLIPAFWTWPTSNYSYVRIYFILQNWSRQVDNCHAKWSQPFHFMLNCYHNIAFILNNLFWSFSFWGTFIGWVWLFKTKKNGWVCASPCWRGSEAPSLLFLSIHKMVWGEALNRFLSLLIIAHSSYLGKGNL